MTIVRILWKDTENMTTVGSIGSRQIGSAAARLAIEAGHEVVLSNSRGSETLAVTVAELGPRASAATSGEAAAAGDIVGVSVPVKAFPDLAGAPLAGKTVIDTCNYGAERGRPHPRARQQLAQLDKAPKRVPRFERLLGT